MVAESPEPTAESSRPELPLTCSYCGRPFVDGEDQLLQMRGGQVVAAYHERCHPNYRRSGCAGC